MISTDTKKAVLDQVDANKKKVLLIKDEIDKLDIQINALNARRTQLQSEIKEIKDSNDRMKVDIGVAA